MSTNDFKPIQGMSDIAAPEVYLWQELEKKARHVFALYGFDEVRTPSLEKTELFTRSIGDATDIVQKEMYSLEDRGGRSLTLRPEGTASIIRHVAGGGPEALESRIFYWGPMFRCERPQAGRKRQFHQVGAEILGGANPASDAECIAMQVHLLSEWGLEGSKVELNTRGIPEDREHVSNGLKAAIEPHLGDLCDNCQSRYEKNVMRVLDCKNETCKKIVESLPPVTDFMSAASREYLDKVQHYLSLLDVETTLNPRLVRGLDYYVHTVWEITHSALGAQDALAGGGRYQIDVQKKVIDGVGFAMGIERIIAALEAAGTNAGDLRRGPELWIVSQSHSAFEDNLVLLQTLRRRGVRCGMDMTGRSMKAQLRAANRAGAAHVVIRGDHEMESGTFQLKNFNEGTQEEVDMPELMDRLEPLRLNS